MPQNAFLQLNASVSFLCRWDPLRWARRPASHLPSARSSHKRCCVPGHGDEPPHLRVRRPAARQLVGSWPQRAFPGHTRAQMRSTGPRVNVTPPETLARGQPVSQAEKDRKTRHRRRSAVGWAGWQSEGAAGPWSAESGRPSRPLAPKGPKVRRCTPSPSKQGDWSVKRARGSPRQAWPLTLMSDARSLSRLAPQLVGVCWLGCLRLMAAAAGPGPGPAPGLFPGPVQGREQVLEAGWVRAQWSGAGSACNLPVRSAVPWRGCS